MIRYKVKTTFAEGITEDDIEQALLDSGYDDTGAPPGNLLHRVSVEDGRLVYRDEWVSKNAYETFVYEVSEPALRQARIPYPDREEL